MNGLLAAFAFMTRIPMPRAAYETELSKAAPWLPVAGAAIGAAVAAAVIFGAIVNPWIGALLGLIVWVLLTGALHIDGLGDVADGLGAAHGSPDRFVEVARDPHLGSFGAVAIALQLMAKLVLLAVLADHATALELAIGVALVAAWARWVPLLLARAVPPLTEGLGSRLAAGVGMPAVIGTGALLAVASLLASPVLLVALPLSGLFALYWCWKLGGVTGDCHGASIEVMESMLLFALISI
jgi:adenosylcobinamide-GDP ribazoletransferase